MNTQQISAVVRQVLAVVAVIMGALTQAVSNIHLPVAVSSVLAFVGGLILVVEHYVSDPSTGSTTPPASSTPAAPAGAESLPHA